MSWPRIFRKEGFNDFLIGANEIAGLIELQLKSRKFHEKKIRRMKRVFLYEAEDQPNDDPKKNEQSSADQLSPRLSYSVNGK